MRNDLGDSGSGQGRPLTRRDLLRGTVAAGTALSLGGLLAACGGGDSAGGEAATAPVDTAALAQTGAATMASGTPKYGGRLRVGLVGGGTSESLSPGKGGAFIDAIRVMNLYDRLAPRAPVIEGQGDMPGLAESIEPNADGSVWTIKLRSGVEFHDGKTLTADDVIYSFLRVLNPDNANNEYDQYMRTIDPDGLRKINDLELEVGLVQPIGDFPGFLQVWARPIVPDGITEEQLVTNPIGTGPFKASEFTPGERSLFLRNENYWVEGTPYLDEIEMITIDDETTRLNALVTGEIDAMGDMNYTQYDAYKDDPEIQILSAPGAQVVAFYMRMDAEPFTDNRVRTAFKLAIDRQAMVDLIYRGMGFVGNDLWGPGWPSYNDELPQREYDPEEAKSLLKQAGYDSLDVTLYTSTALLGQLESAQAFAEQAKASNINIQLERIPPGDQWNTAVQYLKAPFYQTGYGASSFETVFSFSRCGIPSEVSWCFPDWEKEYDEARATLDPDERNAKYKELQVKVWEESGYLVWGYGAHLDAARANVMGFTPSWELPFGDGNFKYYWLA